MIKTKDQILLEQTYTKIVESNQPEDQSKYGDMSDNELLDCYKKEFDKQFDSKTSTDSNAIEGKLKEIFSAIKKRGNALANSAHKYAIHKRELER